MRLVTVPTWAARLVVARLLPMLLACVAATACQAPTSTPPAAVAPTPESVVRVDAPGAPTAGPDTPLPAAGPSQTIATDSAPRGGQTPPRPFSASNALSDLQILAGDIGPRAAGTDGRARAADFLEQRFSAAGLSVRRQAFTFSSYEDLGSTLALPGDPSGDPPARALRLSASGTIEGALVYAGLGTAEEVQQASVSGRIAIVRRGELLFSAKVANLEAAGATAVVIVNNQQGSLQGLLTGPSRVPVIGIPQTDGDRLIERAASTATRATVSVNGAHLDRNGENVVARFGGGPRRVVLGAHYDSVPTSPGANDNASGTAVLLEIARVIAARGPNLGVDIVAFDAEEIGLIGSRRFVAQLSDEERRQIIAMINVDMVGVGNRPIISADQVLADRLGSVASISVPSAGSGRRGRDSSSDHASFQEAGIPAIFISRAEDPRYHTPEDKPAHIEESALTAAGELVLSLLEQLARDPG